MGAPRQNRGMKVFGIAGHSGMGKTTLLERVALTLTARRGRCEPTPQSPRAARAAAIA
jgi:molybdopterin-guanine dinucleotide biosynthesis protein